MRRIEKRFYEKISIHGMSLDGIAEEIDNMSHKERSLFGADGTMFQTPYNQARKIISTLLKYGLIQKRGDKYIATKGAKKER